MQQLTTADALATREAHADRMANILEDWEKMTNDLARTQRTLNYTPDEHTSTPVKELITDVAATKRSANPQAEITVTLPEKPVGAVPSTVGEAFEEIIDNAINATCEKPPRIEIDVARDEDWAEIQITDNGPGLPSAEASVLETGEETQLIHGKGLGVWKVRMLIKQAGGNVAVTVSDAGTTISVQLPTPGTGSIQARVEAVARSP
jgi:K+-sensing histidine kinase KdpD